MCLKKKNDYISFVKEDVFIENSKQINEKFASLEERPTNPNRQKLEYIIKDMKDPVKYTSDNIFTCKIGLLMLKQTIFYKNFRDVTQRLFEAGIIQRIPGRSDYSMSGQFQDQIEIAESFKVYNRKRFNVVLNWKDLCAGFYLWAGAAVFSILILIGEIIKFRLSKLKN